MSNSSVTFACGLYDRMIPLYAGQVEVEGLDLDFVALDSPRDIFDRMAAKDDLDAAEFSSSEFISRMSAGDRKFVAIPAFPSRAFRHSMITVNRNSGIEKPKDLQGKRVGVPIYTMTAALFIRGMLQHDHGVDVSTIQWVQGSMNESGGWGNPTLMPLLKPADIVNNETGKSLSELLDVGEIDAVIGTGLPNSFRTNPDVQRLFPNFREVEQDYFRRTGIFPIMHLVALRRDVYERDPSVAPKLFAALEASRKAALAKMHYTGALRYMLPWLPGDLDEVNEIFGGDPWPYGIEPNRRTLAALVTYMHEQGLIAESIPVDDLFVPV